MLDQAFDALKTYDWGTDRKALNPIDDAAVAALGDSAAREELERRLAAVLSTPVSRDAKDFVCRKLMLIGTATSVPALAALLPEKDHSHMARFALERIPATAACQAMRTALPSLSGALKVGVIGSLGVRDDAAACVPELAASLADSDAMVACAAAYALGDIRTLEAAQALAQAKPSVAQTKQAVTDARLSCAEGMLADGKKAEALAVYKSLAGDGQPKLVRLAATRGMLACAGK
jgi:HEAT repeat protein